MFRRQRFPGAITISRFLAVVLILVVLMIPRADPAAATSDHGGSLSNGPIAANLQNQLRLVLEIGGDAYPLNALVPVTLRLTNLSAQPVHTWDCLSDSLGAVVLQGSGVEVYPPLLPPPGAPWSGCPGGTGMGGMRQMVQIQAGQTLTRMTYVVLRAFTVRAVASLMTQPGQMKPTLIGTPSIQMGETTAPGPSVRIQPGHPISAQVTSIPGAGPILYSEFASCGGTDPNKPFNASATFSQWSLASGTVLHPFTRPCSSVTEWMLFVAQPGHPIAQAYYCAQHDRCAYGYLQPTARERALAACKLGIGKAVTSGRLPRTAARYAIGLSSTLPSGLTPAQRALAQDFHARCAPLLTRPGGRAGP